MSFPLPFPPPIGVTLDPAGAGVGGLTDGAGVLVATGFIAGFLGFAAFRAAALGFLRAGAALLRAVFFADFFTADFFTADFFFADFFFAAGLRVAFRAAFLRAIFVRDFTRAFLDFAAFFAERFFFDAFFAAMSCLPI